MLANPNRFAVIDGGRRQDNAALALSLTLRFDSDDVAALNALLLASGCQRTVKIDGTGRADSKCLATTSLPHDCQLARVRGYKGVFKGMLPSIDATIVSSIAAAEDAVSTATIARAAKVAGFLGRREIMVIHNDSTSNKFTDCLLTGSSLSIRHGTFAGLLDYVAGVGHGGAVIAVSPRLYQPVCDILATMSGAGVLASSFRQTPQETVIIPAQSDGRWSSMSILPTILTTLAIDNAADELKRLEKAWLRTLEDGFVTDGLSTLKPYAKSVSFSRFCEEIRANLGREPRRLTTSLDRVEKPKVALQVVR